MLLRFSFSSSHNSKILEFESDIVCASLSMELTLSVLSPDLTCALLRNPNLLIEPLLGVTLLGAGVTVAVLCGALPCMVAGLEPPELREPDRVLQEKSFL